MLRHRVRGYKAGVVERWHEKLDVHEDYFIDYGFVEGSLRALIYPRAISRTVASVGRPRTPVELSPPPGARSPPSRSPVLSHPTAAH